MTESSNPSVDVCLALGSNLGDRLAALRAAKESLTSLVSIAATSFVYETAPAYALDQPRFLNAALRGTTALDPKSLLLNLKDIECEIGRRPTFRYGPRVIDIDIIFYGDLQIHMPDLTIPHLLMAERLFVLKPLADIAADWVHPGLGRTVAELCEALPHQDEALRTGERL